MSGPPASTVITFDVDGTLIRATGPSANRLHKLAFAHALKQIFDVDTSIDVIQHHGATDPLILLGVLEHHGIQQTESMPRLKDMELAMVQYFEAHAAKAAEGLMILPGVVELLRNLHARPDVAVGLVTGNLEPIGWGKMAALGLLPLFTAPNFGGFGSDFCSGNTQESWRDRGELVRIAAERAERQLPGKLGKRFHVGDTPMDIQAADAGGALPLGVLTGIYTREQLEATKCSASIVEDLNDMQAVRGIFGLS